MEIPIYDLNDGTELPAVGFGTTGLQGADGLEAILSAVHAGYRLLDTAVNYGNEMTVGEAIRRSGVPRPEFRVTSKAIKMIRCSSRLEREYTSRFCLADNFIMRRRF